VTGERQRFGTFSGVFVPCTLMILGVILYLRLGFVTGTAGYIHSLGVVAFACLITTLTALSLSSLATNKRTRGGGAYYLISRSLGVEYGGLIGPVLYLALAASVALYVIGFTEALFWFFPDLPLSPLACATAVNALVFACVFIGAGWTIRLQYLILSAIALSLLSFAAGVLPAFSLARLAANAAPVYSGDTGLIVIFALFFPAVTGIMAGANLSGDLEDPGRAIPLGTLSAIGVTTVVYAAMIVLLAGGVDRTVLLEDSFALGNSARWPALVALGVFAAALSSALSSMMGAPRVLQAFATDGIIPRLQPLGRGWGRNREPRAAIVMTFLIAQLGVFMGDLNSIAPLITVFFILTYGALNLSCFYESITGNPSFRPMFRFNHWTFSLAGALACGAAMFAIAPLLAAGALLGALLLLKVAKRKEMQSRWGDVQWGNAYERARRALLRLEREPFHPKSWRPALLAIRPGRWSGALRTAEYAAWLQGGRGIVTLAQVVPGSVDTRMALREEESRAGRDYVHSEELDAFYTVVVEDDLNDGLQALLQCHGIGRLRPNTVLFEWQDDPRHAQLLSELVDTAVSFDCNAIAVRSTSGLGRWQTREGTVDVWWHSRKHGALMLMFAHLLTHAHAWRDRPIRLLHAVPSESERDELLPAFEELINSARVRARPLVVVSEDIASSVREHSSQASLVILGMDERGRQMTAPDWHSAIQRVAGSLEEVLLISSVGDVRLGD
jgi:amino acid transporter